MFKSAQFRLQLIVLFWGFTGILGKLIDLGALSLVWYRMLIAVIVIYIFLRFKGESIKVSRKNFLIFIGLGMLLGVHWYTFFESIKVSNISIALSTLSTGALFTAFLEPIFFKKRINLYEIGLAGIVSICIMVIFDASPEYKLGIALGVLCSFLASLFFVLNAKLQRNTNPTNIVFYEMLGGVFIVTVFISFSKGTWGQIFSVSGLDFFYLLILGVLCTAYTQIEAIALLKHISPFTLVLNVNLEPVYGIIIAYFIFDDSERMNLVFYIATAVMILSVFVNSILKTKFQHKGRIE